MKEQLQPRKGPKGRKVCFFIRLLTRINKSCNSIHSAAFSGLRTNFPLTLRQICRTTSQRQPHQILGLMGQKLNNHRVVSTTEGVESNQAEHFHA